MPWLNFLQPSVLPEDLWLVGQILFVIIPHANEWFKFETHVANARKVKAIVVDGTLLAGGGTWSSESRR